MEVQQTMSQAPKRNKLPIIALSVLGLAAVGITGASWYTGQQLEQHQQVYLDRINQHLKSLESYGIQSTLSDVKLDRGIFSSSLNYKIQLTGDMEAGTLQFTGHDKLFHGPLPLNRLMQGKFNPVAMSAETNLVPEGEAKAWFNNQASALTTQVNAGYSGELSGVAKVAALTIPHVFDAQNIEYQFDLTDLQQYPNSAIGKMAFSAKQFNVYDEDQQKLSFNDLNASSSNQLVGQIVKSSGKLSTQFAIQQQNLGKLVLDSSASSDVKAYEELMALASHGSQSGNIEQVLTQLFASESQLKIDRLAFENSKGSSEAALNIDLKAFDPAKLQSLGEFLTVFKPSLLDINVNTANLEEFIKQSAVGSGVPEQDAQQIAEQQIAEIMDQAQSSNLVKVDGTAIKLKLSVENGKVHLNGREVSETEMQNALFMLMLGISSMGL